MANLPSSKVSVFVSSTERWTFISSLSNLELLEKIEEVKLRLVIYKLKGKHTYPTESLLEWLEDELASRQNLQGNTT